MTHFYEILFILFYAAVHLPGVIGAKCKDSDIGIGFRNPADGVCSNVDIRISMDQFKRLENCTVVEGFLHISLMERAVHEDYDKWSFPELREITAYLRLYRVYGLKTLRNLFPNLTVIGGRQLFSNYALVAYEMPDLEELGLVSLRTIRRGGVRITKSKKLCYVDTVDWGRLGVDAAAQDFKDNKEESQCANYCPDHCPITRIGNVATKRCWTSQHCQLGLTCMCKMNGACMNNGTCCHEYCVGGCKGNGPGDCYSCKGVTYQGMCLKKCPPDTFMFADRRCLKVKECLAVVNNTEDIGANAKILRGEKGEPGTCVTKCPQNYTVREEGELKNLECVRCQGFCPKVCNSTEVNSIEDAEKLKDCSKIEGSLTIQIMSGSNVAHEMEKNLGNIKEITGFLSVRRSYALLTLYFLKNLEIIGDTPLHQGHSLIVMDNSNLQELFPEEQMKRLKFKRGKVSFHGNRKLCLYKINKFVKYVNLSDPLAKQDISSTTNGDLKSCTEQHLNITVINKNHTIIKFNWTKDTSDTRHLLTYIINYKEIKDKNENIDIYQGRDACSIDAWMTIEQPPADNLEPYQSYMLEDLNAYTTYAIYVYAYTLPTATHSAMTNVITVTTDPYFPSEPLDLEVTSENPHELVVKWKPPKFPNGKVTHYKVMYHKQALDVQSFAQRNYCRDRPASSAPKETTKEKEEEVGKKLNVTATCCQCPKTKEELDAEARIQEIEIYFENYLHDQVYCQRYDTLPLDIVWNGTMQGWSDIINWDRGMGDKYTSTSNTEDVLVHLSGSAAADNNSTAQGNVSYSTNITTVVHEVLIYNATRIVLQTLEHFQEYNIEVQACHETNTNEPGTKLCSNRAMTAGHTAASPIMDRINESTINVKIVENITFDVLITWDPPPNPNGVILTYNIFYKKANLEHVMPHQICVNNKEFQKHSGYLIIGVEPGNWTFQINSVSLAGNSSITAEKFFLVPHPADEESIHLAIIIITGAVVTALFILIITAYCLHAKYKKKSDSMTVFSENINYVPSDQMYTMDDWEVDRDKIKLIRELGQGSFGMVYEGVAKGLYDDPNEEIRVAVKTVNDRANFNDRREFLKEATTMKAFDCYHVVKLLGVVSTGHPALVIMELMALGDLKNYLREQRPDEHERPGVSPPKLLDILQMAGEIADGMAYLADKKFVHRDLAARNCMVAEDKTVKIGDFGMTRDIYETDYYRKGGKGMLPVRWMAPESLKDGVFTSMSDVWSYGIVMWEMVTLAAQPYQGLSNEEVVKFISEGSTMDTPDRCPQEMSYLMQRCWAKKPKNRPTFKDIIEYLLPHLNSRFEKVSYYFSEGRGPGNKDESTARDQAEGKDDACSLSFDGAAAPKLSLTEDCGSNSSSRSLNHSGGSVSLYDVCIDPEMYPDSNRDTSPFFPHMKDSSTKENLQDGGSCGFHNEFSMNPDDLTQPFLPNDFQSPLWQPSEFTPKQSGSISVPSKSRFVELQPLINKGSNQVPSSPKSIIRQPLYPDTSEYIDHHPPIIVTTELTHLTGPETSHENEIVSHTSPDPLLTGAHNTASLPRQQNWQSPPKSVHSPVITLPKLRLPALNQPPSGGFRRLPLYKSRDRNISSSKNSDPGINIQNHHQPSDAAASHGVVVSAEGDSNLPSLLQHSFHPPNSLISSNDSNKNTGSDSFINGVTNGHIPVSTLRHRTSLC